MKQPPESILFFTPFGYWQVHNQLDLAVASAARLRGLRTTYVTCDAFYKPCAMERGQIDCESCQGSMDEIASPFSIAREPLSALIMPDEIAKADAWLRELDDGSLPIATYDDLEVGDWALSNVMTQFRIGNLADLRRDEIVPVHRRFLRDALLTYWAIGRVIERDQIDATFLFNGRFYPYRAALEASQQRGLRVLVHERGRIANSFSFFEDESVLSKRTVTELVAAWADQPLADDELEKVDHHFSQLLRGRSPAWPSFYDQVQAGDPTDVLDIPANAKIVGFFSSSSDEIASHISFAKVTSQFELIDNVAAVLEEAGVYLIVRHHPHIGGGPVGSPVEPSAFFEAYLRTRSRRTNMRVLMPKDELNSYALFPYLDAAIAPFTSLGLETTAAGIPTLVAQSSISAFDSSYEVDDWSVPALRRKIAFLLGPESQLDGERLKRFCRTFYSRFHRFSLRSNVVGIEDYIMPSVNPNFADSLQPGRDSALDRMMDFLIEGRHVHERPIDRQGSEPSEAAENEHIARRLDIIKDRSGWRQVSLPPPRPSHRNEERVAILCEELVWTPSTSASWQGLPNADRVSIVPFFREASNAWLSGGSFRSAEQRDFEAWSRGLLKALDGTGEDRVMVLSRRYQLHDASMATILSRISAEKGSTGEVLMVGGWFADVARFRPDRVASSVTSAQWRELRAARPRELRGQDVLSLGVVDKAWLRRNLGSAEALEEAFFDAAACSGQPASSSPVFLWQ